MSITKNFEINFMSISQNYIDRYVPMYYFYKFLYIFIVMHAKISIKI